MSGKAPNMHVALLAPETRITTDGYRVEDLWSEYRRAWRGEPVDLYDLRARATKVAFESADQALVVLIGLLNDDLDPDYARRSHP